MRARMVGLAKTDLRLCTWTVHSLAAAPGWCAPRLTVTEATVGSLIGYCAGLALLAIEKIRLHRSFPLNVNRPARFEPKRIAQCVARRGRNVDAAGQTIGFHSLGGIYGVAPDIICNFVGAEHTGDDRPSGVDPDAQLQLFIETATGGVGGVEHGQCHFCDRDGGSRRLPLDPTGHHIAVADCLDGLESVVDCEIVEI